ncbi:MAG: baseplate J/gp47 family protein [Candidatus Methanoperedens sp.]
MSIPIPNLDDRSFEDLMKEARALIPRYNSDWTNHNPSDPGITLLELFSWLGEMVIYRINQVPEESYINFLKLISGVPERGDLDSLLNGPYLFNWNTIQEDNFGTFRNYLKNELDIDWAVNATINKNVVNKTLIAVEENGMNRAELIISDSEDRANLKINGSQVRYLHVENKSGELNIYNVPDIDAEYRYLLNLLKAIEDGEKKSVIDIKEASVGYMESRYRVITSNDFEEKALSCMKKLLQIDPAGRVVCMNNRDLEYSTVDNDKPGHVSVIIIPGWVKNSPYCTDKVSLEDLPKGETGNGWNKGGNGKVSPTGLLKEEVKADLDARKLITTRVHVVSPFYQDVSLKVWIALKENTDETTVISQATGNIMEYFHPITGGPDGTGWPLGRNVYRSELYNLLETIPGVDHVVKVWINDDSELPLFEIEKHKLIALPDLIVEKVSDE